MTEWQSGMWTGVIITNVVWLLTSWMNRRKL
jgi:hypothetical protein